MSHHTTHDIYEGYVTLLCLHFEIKTLKDFWFLTGSDPLMTFDLKTVGTLKTPNGNNACVLTMSLCYVICKDSDFLNIFHNFWLSKFF